MADSTTFRFWPDAEITATIALYKDGLNAVLETGQSYSANGVNFSRADFDSLNTYLGFLYAEQARRSGNPTAINRAYPIVRRDVGGRGGRYC